MDAAGAIYVLGGGYEGTGFFNDVLVSTDGGARPVFSRLCARLHACVCVLQLVWWCFVSV